MAQSAFASRHCFLTEVPVKGQTHLSHSQPLSPAPIKTSISHHREGAIKREDNTDTHLQADELCLTACLFFLLKPHQQVYDGQDGV